LCAVDIFVAASLATGDAFLAGAANAALTRAPASSTIEVPEYSNDLFISFSLYNSRFVRSENEVSRH
jgi:hypothetical protein